MTTGPRSPHLEPTSLFLAGVFAVGGVALVGTVAGFFGRTFWLLDLAAHFRPQFAAILLPSAAILLLAGNRWAGSLFGVAGAANVVLLLPFLIPSPAGSMTGRLDVGLLNLDIFNESPGLVIEELESRDPDLMVLVEFTAEWSAALAEWRASYPHRIELPRASPFGIAMVSKLPLRHPETIRIVPDAGPAILAQVDLAGRALDVLALHPFPPLRAKGTALRDRELEAAAEVVRARSAPTVVIGDLNTSYWSYALRDLLSRTGLRPAALGSGLQPTWPSDQRILSVHLDHVLVPDPLGVEDFERGSFVGSDHYPVWTTLGWRVRDDDAL